MPRGTFDAARHIAGQQGKERRAQRIVGLRRDGKQAHAFAHHRLAMDVFDITRKQGSGVQRCFARPAPVAHIERHSE
jgi:hypothetical protein